MPAADTPPFSIDSTSSVPPFEQLRVQFLARIDDGELAAGARLPTVRQLAQELGIAANTVARSYRELEADGVIETRGRNGSFVSSHGSVVEQRAQEAAAEYATRIRQLGVEPEHAITLVSVALKDASRR